MTTAPDRPSQRSASGRSSQRIRRGRPPPPAWVAVGLGDDAAVVEPARNPLGGASPPTRCVEGVHFDRAFTPPRRRSATSALAVNLSDLAAMGAEPRAALLSLVLPAGAARGRLRRAARRLFTRSPRRTRVTLVGGNITRSPGPLHGRRHGASGTVTPPPRAAREAARGPATRSG
ncbi:MAG: AIR synthase related protein [Desulfomicrobium escambiense]|nr:AIR synthase related protein [Desulfomicrobium escambiense]